MGRIPAALIAVTVAALAWAQTEPDEILATKDGEYISVTPTEAHDAGLPARTGKGGQCVKVASDASGFEYGTCGGGGTATPLSNTPAEAPAAAAAAGSASDASRGDHQHPFQPLSSFGAVGSAGTCAKANSSRNGLSYGSCGSPRALANFNPLADGTADPGNRTDVSRADHVHPGGGGGTATPLSDATPAALGTAAAGSASAASRGDHVHLLPADIATNKAAITANKTAADAHRQVPDPQHRANGDVLTINAGAYAFAALPGDSTTGTGWTLLGTDTINFSGFLDWSFTTAGEFQNGDLIYFTQTEAGTSSRNLNISVYGPYLYTTETAPTQTIANCTQTTGGCVEIDMRLGRDSNISLLYFGTDGVANDIRFAAGTYRLYRYRGGGAGGTATPLSDGKPAALGTAAPGTGTAASRGDHVHPTPLPPLNAANAKKFVGISSGGDEFEAIDAGTIIDFGLPDIAGQAGKCLVAESEDLTGVGERTDVASWQDCTAAEEESILNQDLDRLDDLTVDLIAGAASADPTFANNTIARDGGIAYIASTSTTPALSGVTFQTATVPKPQAGWGTTGQVIARIRDNQDVRMWRELETVPGLPGGAVAIPGNNFRNIVPSSGAVNGYTYYSVIRTPPLDQTTKVELQRTGSSSHLGQSQYLGSVPALEAKVNAINNEELLWAQGFDNLSGLEVAGGVSLGTNPGNAIRTAMLSRDPYRQFRLLVEFVDTVEGSTPRSGFLQGYMAGSATGEPIAATETAIYYGGLTDSGGTDRNINLMSEQTSGLEGSAKITISTGTVTGDATNPEISAYLYGYR